MKYANRIGTQLSVIQGALHVLADIRTADTVTDAAYTAGTAAGAIKEAHEQIRRIAAEIADNEKPA